MSYSENTPRPSVDQIAGFQALVDWCGGWPWFHDAEIVRSDRNRQGKSRLVIQVIGGSRPTFGPRANPKFAVPPEDVTVTFILQYIEDLELFQFSHQNVIFDLSLEPYNGMFRITLAPCYGLAGTIDVRTIQIEFKPASPPNVS
jgi:hypothetical protein